MNPPTYLVATLWIRDGRVAEFEAYEWKTARIMQRYGGSIERAIRLTETGTAPDMPFEVHVVRFPDNEMFDAWRADEEARSRLLPSASRSSAGQ